MWPQCHQISLGITDSVALQCVPDIYFLVPAHRGKGCTGQRAAITKAHSFSRATEFRAEPRNLAVAAEFPYFRGISRNSA